jgi:Putative beta-barrel porin-2, OmpL-like. bbp2
MTRRSKRRPARLRILQPRTLMLRSALVAGAVLGAIQGAQALTPPTPITIDGGPLGPLLLSGGADGYAYALTGSGSAASPGLLGTDRAAGAEFLNGLIELQKASGLVQFTLQAGSTGSLTLGEKPTQTSVQTYDTGPLFNAYVTLAPSPHFSISAGQMPSLEGYESTIDWNNANLLNTSLFYVENTQSTGVSATVSGGPVSATVMFGDGFDTKVFNFLQLSATYTIDTHDALTLYGATNLGRTGVGAHFYGSATTPYSASFLGFGPAGGTNYVNSTMVGAYYSASIGNLTIVPEVQYVYAKADAALGLPEFSSNFGAALFADYQFGTSPYSLGGWLEYFSSNGPDLWFLNPGARGFGLSVTPTWQHDHLFLRGDIGLLHLISTGQSGATAYAGGYGQDLTGRNQADFLLEAGVLF